MFLLLTMVENDTLEMINPTSISGHTSSSASKTCFDFEDEEHDLGAQLDDNKSHGITNTSKTKKSSVVKRLNEDNDAATRARAVLRDKQMASKAKYYQDKLELMRQKKYILSHIVDAYLLIGT